MKNPVSLLKRKFPQIRGRDIGQLQRAGKRLKRLANGALHADWSRTTNGRALYAAIIDKSLLGAKALAQELERRRIKSPAFRSALPLKQQRILEASMNSIPAQNLLRGASLAIS